MARISTTILGVVTAIAVTASAIYADLTRIASSKMDASRARAYACGLYSPTQPDTPQCADERENAAAHGLTGKNRRP